MHCSLYMPCRVYLYKWMARDPTARRRSLTFNSTFCFVDKRTRLLAERRRAAYATHLHDPVQLNRSRDFEVAIQEVVEAEEVVGLRAQVSSPL